MLCRTEREVQMQIDVVRTLAGLECQVGGDLGSAATARLRRFGVDASTQRRNVHLDLTRVTKMEPPGLGCLLGVIRTVRGAGGRVSIRAERWLRNELTSVGADRFVSLQ